MAYLEYVSQFSIYDNPPAKKGFHRHHIVPISEQVEPDNRQIYVTPAQHLWLHILYDQENGTKTAQRFLSICGKPADYFDCWEKCLAYSYTLRKKWDLISEKLSGEKHPMYGRTGENNPNYGRKHTLESRQKMSENGKGKHNHHGINNPMFGKKQTNEARKLMSEKHFDCSGKNNPTYGKICWNNGLKNTYAYECPGPEYVKGMLKKRKTL